MTVKLLCDWEDDRDGKKYKALNLLTTDAGTEADLIEQKIAESNLTGGTAYVAPTPQAQFVPVMATTNLTGGIGLQVGGVQALAVGGLQNVTYDGSNRVISYDTLGVAHTVTYPDATHIVDSGGGVITTITLDGSGRITGVVRS